LSTASSPLTSASASTANPPPLQFLNPFTQQLNGHHLQRSQHVDSEPSSLPRTTTNTPFASGALQVTTSDRLSYHLTLSPGFRFTIGFGAPVSIGPCYRYTTSLSLIRVLASTTRICTLQITIQYPYGSGQLGEAQQLGFSSRTIDSGSEDWMQLLHQTPV
jgi:hypothetical protein